MPGGAPMIAPETGRRRTLRPRLARAGSAPRQPRPAFRRPKPPAAPRHLCERTPHRRCRPAFERLRKRPSRTGRQQTRTLFQGVKTIFYKISAGEESGANPSLPRARAFTHLLAESLPPPPCGEDRLGRRPTEEGWPGIAAGLGPAQGRREGDDQDLRQIVTCVAGPRVRHARKRLPQALYGRPPGANLEPYRIQIQPHRHPKSQMRFPCPQGGGELRAGFVRFR